MPTGASRARRERDEAMTTAGLVQRRSLLRVAGTAAAATIAGGAGAPAAAPWPARPVRVVVPFPPGQSLDVLTRAVADAMARRLGQPVAVENRGGGAGVPGTEAVAHAPPDGHTLGVGSVSTLAANPALLPRLPYAVGRDVVAVAGLYDIAIAVLAHAGGAAAPPPGGPAELVAWLRTHPGTRFASAGPATTPHLAGELVARRLGLALEHVPYRGSAPALADLAAGVVPLAFDTVAAASPLVSTGRVRAVAVLSRARFSAWPGVPTLAETVLPGFEATAWGGLVAPGATPPGVLDAIAAAVREALADPAVGERLAALGAAPRFRGPADFAAFVRGEAERWGAVVRETGVRLDG